MWWLKIRRDILAGEVPLGGVSGHNLIHQVPVPRREILIMSVVKPVEIVAERKTGGAPGVFGLFVCFLN